MKAYLLIFTLIFSISSYSKDNIKFVGTFLKMQKNDPKNITGDEYYFVVEKDLERKAIFPVEISDKKLKAKIKAGSNKLSSSYYISAQLKYKKVQIGEQDKNIPYLKIDKYKKIDLAQLSLQKEEYKPSDALTVSKNSAEVSHTVDGINDTLTNTIIGVAGALILGDIFFNK